MDFKTVLTDLSEEVSDKEIKSLKEKIQKAYYTLEDFQTQYKKLTGKRYVF
jgi:signal recognition particle GTPase